MQLLAEPTTFPKPEACRAAALELFHAGAASTPMPDALCLGHDPDPAGRARTRTGDLTAAAGIAVAPGALILHRHREPLGREPIDQPAPDHVHHVIVAGTEHARWRGQTITQPASVYKELHDTDLCPSCGADTFAAFLAGLLTALGATVAPAPTLHGPPEPARRSPCRWWSDRSRARMIRTLATVDWRPIFFIPGTRPAMVTLTYPGDWLTVAPDAETAKGHLRLFHERLRRLYAKLGLPAPPAIWKLEFQRRGAPHFHLYLPTPIGKLGRRAGPRWAGVNFGAWCSWTWADIVNHPDPDEKLRHQLAGTGVDFAEGARCSDPKRLAVYFTRHNAKGGRSKAHQHRVPDEWADAGRWWGTWGVERIAYEAPVRSDELRAAKRFLRSYLRSHKVREHDSESSECPGAGRRCRCEKVPRTMPVQVRRGVSSTGVVGRRWVRRRYELRSLGQGQGAFVITNDGPALAAHLARFLEWHREGDGPPTPEERRRLLRHPWP